VTPSSSRARLPLLAIIVLLAAYVFSIFFRDFLTILATALERDLGLGPADLGAIGGAWFFAFALMQFPIGYLLDHKGPRITVSAMMLAGVAGLAIFSQSTGFWSALIGMSLMGIGCAPVFMGSLFILARIVPPERFGIVVSVFVGFGSLGNLLGATPLALAVKAIGWRETMLVIMAAFALVAGLIWLIVRDPAKPADAAPQEGVWQGLASVMKIRPLWILMPLVLTGYAILVTERGLWIGPFFSQVHGYDVIAQGNAAFLMAVTMTVGALLFGPFERVMRGPKPAVIWSTALVAASFAALALSSASAPGGAAQALFWLGLIGFAGFSYGALMGHARMFMPEHLIGRGMTFVNFGFIAGAGAVQFASGRFIQAANDAGRPAVETYSLLHLGFAVTLAAALAIYAFTPRRPA
jgi:MFS family permease